jgi:hypothetical protein
MFCCGRRRGNRVRVTVTNATKSALDRLSAEAFDRSVSCGPPTAYKLEAKSNCDIVIHGCKKTQITHIVLKPESGAAKLPLQSYKLYKIIPGRDGARGKLLVKATPAGFWIVHCDCRYEISDK